MKTMKNVFGARTLSSVMLTGLILLASCEDKVEFNSKDSASVENEAAVDGYFEDTDDMAVSVVSADDGTLDGGRTDGGRVVSKLKLDHRFACETTTVTIDFAADNTVQVPHGTITVDFGTGCTDVKGNIRKGKIMVEFKGRRFFPNSTIITTTDGYSINDVKLEGTRTVTNVTGSTNDAPKFNVVLDNGKATWPDGSTATREVNRTRVWTRAANPLNDQWSVTGTASGTNRSGNVYEMNITSDLIYKRECAISARVFMAVAGTKELTVNGRKLTIDYGAGDCDRTVTITVDGQDKQVEVKGDI
jgi:predicted secreted protein